MQQNDITRQWDRHLIPQNEFLVVVVVTQLLVFKTHGATHFSVLGFLNAVGGRLAAASGDARETTFLW